MPSPRSLVIALYSHWDVVEWLVRASRELPAFEESQLLHAVARFSPSWSAEACAEAVRGLISNDVLQLPPRSSHFQLNPYVLEFVRGLSCEHKLSLSAILQARVQAVRDATSQLIEGLQQRDMDLLREAARDLAEFFRQISRQLEQEAVWLAPGLGSAS